MADESASSDLPRLTAEQTAERLGVKLETLYAYVARGRLERTRTPGGSSFDPLEVERFAATRRQRSAAAPAPDRGHSDGRPLMVIETRFAHIEDGELFYRGRDAAELAATTRFEAVAHWSLTGRWGETAEFAADAAAVAQARTVADALPSAATNRDRQQVAVTALAAADPLRYALDPDTVVTAAEALVAGMVDVLPELRVDAATGDDTSRPIAERLWSRLTTRPATPAGLHALNAALVLLIDHDIAISTLAARAAASARANAYAVVTAGLGALDSPLHGNASRAAHRMLARVTAGEHPERVIADTMVSAGGPVPGFGQVLYRGVDPRARLLLGMLRDDPGAAGVVEAVDRVAGLIRSRTGARPNVDLALAALALASGMPDDAGEVVFATARTVGWIVHALDEYRQQPLRLRPVGRFVG
ncbi:citrate synthase [Leifsonia sp. NPDC058248]|uniref:citrate synthase n=1 Tax=Leifsonia sp. NPDC058248 TaxID=3346402 RepID=UPI0036DA51F6